MTDNAIRLMPWPLPTADFSVDAKQSALLMIDMQEMVCRPGVGLGIAVDTVPSVANYFWPRIQEVIPNQKRLLEYFRSIGGRIIHTTVGPHTDDGSDLTPWRRRRNARMNEQYGAKTYFGGVSPEHGLISEVAPIPGELVLNKPTFGAFASTGIEHLLRNWDIRFLVICGEATNMCVYMTAAEAADRGFECAIVEDACAAFDRGLHTSFLQNFALMLGRVVNTDVILAELINSQPDGDVVSVSASVAHQKYPLKG